MKTDSELEVLAEKHGWKARPLTFAKIQRMSSDEALFHSRMNKAEFDRALAEPELTRKTQADVAAQATERYWNENQTTEESIEQVKRFVARHPQLRGDLMSNREALVDYLRTHKQTVTEANLTTAFQILG